jgi:hypothetical protein
MLPPIPQSASAISSFDPATTHSITVMMQQHHARLAQLDRPTLQRSLTARNYDSAIKALGGYLARINTPLPTKKPAGAVAQ